MVTMVERGRCGAVAAAAGDRQGSGKGRATPRQRRGNGRRRAWRCGMPSRPQGAPDALPEHPFEDPADRRLRAPSEPAPAPHRQPCGAAVCQPAGPRAGRAGLDRADRRPLDQRPHRMVDLHQQDPAGVVGQGRATRCPHRRPGSECGEQRWRAALHGPPGGQRGPLQGARLVLVLRPDPRAGACGAESPCAQAGATAGSSSNCCTCIAVRGRASR